MCWQTLAGRSRILAMVGSCNCWVMMTPVCSEAICTLLRSQWQDSGGDWQWSLSQNCWAFDEQSAGGGNFYDMKKLLLFLECGLCGSQSSRQHRHWRRYPDSGGLIFLSSYLDLIIWQVIINCGALPCLLQLLSAPKESIRKEVETTKLEISEMMLTGDVMTLYCQIPHFLLLPQLES